MVKINVLDIVDEGEPGTSFHVHKTLICHYSPYFKAKFNHPVSKENGVQSADIRHTSKEPFGRFIEWIYTQELRDTSNSKMDEWSDEEEESAEGLIDLWILADDIQVPGLQNLAIDALEYHRDWLCRIKAEQLGALTEHIYELTEKDSKLRRWFFSSLAALSLSGYLKRSPEKAANEIQKFIDASSPADDLSIHENTMRKRAEMMQFYVEDPEMSLQTETK
ncbi:hypothetical protein EAF04_001431 [Stromatinia cepivora]|nr:hypothetical protein EAF04_001431 [Stromatinia cepivora]